MLVRRGPCKWTIRKSKAILRRAAEGLRHPCSTLWMVRVENPKSCAKSAWLNPRRSRMALMESGSSSPGRLDKCLTSITQCHQRMVPRLADSLNGGFAPRGSLSRCSIGASMREARKPLARTCAGGTGRQPPAGAGLPTIRDMCGRATITAVSFPRGPPGPVALPKGTQVETARRPVQKGCGQQPFSRSFLNTRDRPRFSRRPVLFPALRRSARRRGLREPFRRRRHKGP